jgi:spermidine/putrescine transport system ATP-binding protein
VRPEQLRLGKTADGGLQARVVSLVYFGTDTHCHLHLADGTELVARLQSPASGEAGLSRGTAWASVSPRALCSGWRTEP